MNAKTTFLIVLFCSFLTQFSFGQVEVPVTDKLLEKLRINNDIKGIEDTYYSDIEGSPYYFKDFMPGTIELANGETYNELFKYDIYADQILFKGGSVIYAIAHPELIKNVKINNLTFIYSAYKSSANDEKTEDGYFIMENDGNGKLLVHNNMRIQDPEPPKLYQDAKPAKFIRTSDTYYIKINDEEAIKINGKKDINSIFGSYSAQVSDYVKRQKLNLKKMDDLLRMVNFYNTLNSTLR